MSRAARQHRNELAAARMRRTRERRREEVCMLRVTVDNLLGDRFVAAGLLHPNYESDREKITNVASVLLRSLSAADLRKVARNVMDFGNVQPSAHDQARPNVQPSDDD